jgi:predicted nucleic acid-binding protein
MPRCLLDTSCMIAALCAWHEHHERATRELDQRLSTRETLVVAAPALVETYSVLSRLPAPHRLSPAECWALLEADFLGDAMELIALEPDAYRQLLRSAPNRGIAGGSIYDAVIVACGLAARVETILTFNERQFRALAGQEIQIVVPT